MMKATLCCVMLWLVPTCWAQSCFNRTFADDNGNLGLSVVVTDSGYMVCGFGYSPNYNEWLATKFLGIDTAGNLKWMKLIGEASYAYRPGWPGSFTETLDGNYIYGGSSLDSSESTSQGILCKLNRDGDTLWVRRFGRPNVDYYYFERARPTRDGGYVCIGKRRQGQSLYFYAMKTDSAGQMLWEHTYGLPGYGHGYAIEQTADGGFVMSGVSDGDGTGTGLVVPYVVKTDSGGQVQWQKNYAQPGLHGPAHIIPSKYGGYYLWGSLEQQPVAEQYYLHRLDSAGTVIWTHWFPSDLDTYIGQVRELADGSTIAVGQTPLPGIFWDGGLITKLSPTGQMAWQREYPRYNLSGMNVQGGFQSFKQTSDMGFIITGIAIVDTGGGNYTNDFWVVKTDSNGCFGADCGVTGLEEIPTAIITLVKAYPNPATTELTLEILNGNMPEVKLYNMFGETALTSKLTSGAKTVLDIGMLPNGVYLYRIGDVEGNLATGKLVILR